MPAANDQAGSRLQVPAGFALNTYFTGLRAPRLMTVGPDGALYVAERGANAVVRLPDANGDGVADERQVVAQNLAGAHSVEWHEGALYVGTDGSVMRLEDQNADGDFFDEGEQDVLTDNIPNGGVHSFAHGALWPRRHAVRRRRVEQQHWRRDRPPPGGDPAL